MPDLNLAEAAEMIRCAMAALDRAGGEADLAAAMLDHALMLIEQPLETESAPAPTD